MPDPERLLHTLRRAVEACRDAPGRRGRVVALDADEVLVAGDLHGNVENFRRILQRADLARFPRRHLVVQELVHGPHRYPRGGDKSHQLLDLFAALKSQYPARVHFLPGNHELAQWTQRPIGKEDVDLNEQFRVGVAAAYGPRADEVYAAYRDLIAAAPLALRTGNRVFLSHSLPQRRRVEAFDLAALERDETAAEDLVPGGSVYVLLWGRDTSPETVAAFLGRVDADLLVTGHIPCEAGFAVPNDRQVIVDCVGEPACTCLFPAARPLTHEELVAGVQAL